MSRPCWKNPWVIGSLSVVGLSLFIGLLAGSFATLTPQQYGLKFNTVTKTFDDTEVYSSTRAYVGVGSYFIKFPRNLQYIEWTGSAALDVWSQDGQSIFVEASFYYGLRPSKLHEIFYTFDEEFDAIVRGMAAEIIRDVATNFETSDYFSRRADIDGNMTVALQTRLFSSAYVNVTLFNLLGIGLPKGFENAIIDRVVQEQSLTTLNITREVKLAQSQITLINSNAGAQVAVINAQANADAVLIQKRKAAQLVTTLQERRAAALATLTSTLGLTAGDDVLKFMYADVIRGAFAANHSSSFFDTKSMQIRS